jgi:hypothetical protein
MRAVDFFRGERNSDGRTIHDILKLKDGALEKSHDIVQWCFPTHVESNFNPDAPIITYEEYCILHRDPNCRDMMQIMFSRWLTFYGIEEVEGVYTFDPEKVHFCWKCQIDHNHLRISRIIRSLRFFGCDEQARLFYDVAMKLAEHFGKINANSRSYWTGALKGSLWEPVVPLQPQQHDAPEYIG